MTLFAIMTTLAVVLSANASVAQNIVHGVKVVVIDAGHGGKFPGASYAGVREKDLTLDTALELGRLIETEMVGVKVVYTRKTDKELGETLATDLQRRADIANKAGGDLFISIHVNAARSTSARGVETLIMGESSKEQRYNESALFDNNSEDLIDMSDEKTAAIVRAYIQNLQFTYGEYSMAMARCIQQQYRKAERQDRGIKPQLLRVLYATDMPGVLTEIGFMSNPTEMAYLKSKNGVREIARSLFEAVKSYSELVKGSREGDEHPEEGGSVAVQPEVTPSQKSESETPRFVMPERTEEQKKGSSQDDSGYAVQIVASPDELPLSSTKFKSYRGKVKQFMADGRYCYKYCVGLSDQRSQAQALQAEVRREFPDAFVVRCEAGRVVK